MRPSSSTAGPSVGRVRRRRLVLAAGAALISPVVARAQKADKPYRVGILGTGSSNTLQRDLAALGYVENRDVAFVIRDAEGRADRFDALAADLVRLQVTVIVAATPAAALSAKRATSTIPIVMMHTPDPVQLGLVSSLARPGGNITGVTTLSSELSIKQLTLLKDALPRVSRVALLWNPDNPWHPTALRALQAGGDAMGLHLRLVDLRGPDRFDAAFRSMASDRMEAVLVLADSMTYFYRRPLAALAMEHRLAMMGSLPEYAEAGSLMSYWADTSDAYRRVASYVDRILKGAKPGDLPIEQPTRFEFVANLKTAKALGIAFAPSVLLRADRVIE